MITELGKQLRILRIENNQLLKDMSGKLGITPAYLSSIENGKRRPTKEIIHKLFISYDFDEKEKNSILESYYKTIESIEFSSKNASEEQLNLGLAFAREFNKLDSEDIDKIMKILSK